MTIDRILSLGPALADFVDQFSDCFGRSEPRGHLASYIRGQWSNLPRESALADRRVCGRGAADVAGVPWDRRVAGVARRQAPNNEPSFLGIAADLTSEDAAKIACERVLETPEVSTTSEVCRHHR